MTGAELGKMRGAGAARGLCPPAAGNPKFRNPKSQKNLKWVVSGDGVFSQGAHRRHVAPVGYRGQGAQGDSFALAGSASVVREVFGNEFSTNIRLGRQSRLG